MNKASTQQAAQSTELWQKLYAKGDMWFSFALLGVIFILVLPLPPLLIDLLLTLSITIGVLVVLTVSNVKNATEFSVFPTLLLFVTLFRLGLNVATTRAILTGGDAGNLIDAFGQFVVGGNVIVGLIVFIILTLINFIVITKGAGRVAEVAARFALDALPGKQMSIDADLNAGLLSEQEARAKREQLQKDSSFFGAMDGASKFVRGDAVAGILITAINLVGGIGVGVLQMNLSVGESVKTFTLLSVGDGLVSQIPALLVSTAAGIIITRSSSSLKLGTDVARQVFSSRRAIWGTGGLLWALMFVPGFPVPILFLLGGVVMGVGYLWPQLAGKDQVDDSSLNEESDATKGQGVGAKSDQKESKDRNKVEVLILELGLDLLPLVHGDVKNIIDRIASLRRSLSFELGITIPTVSVRDNSGLPPHSYRLLLRGHEVASAECYVGHVLAMGTGSMQRPLQGRKSIEPAFGLPATWIPDSERKQAERLGYAVVDPISVLTTHLNEVLKMRAADLLSRQNVQLLLDELKESHAAVLQEMNNLQLGIGTVHRVLQNLLREKISIRELPLILEKLCDQIQMTKNIDELSEAARKELVFEIARLCDMHENKLICITLDAELEQTLLKSIRQTTHEITLAMDPNIATHLHNQLKVSIEDVTNQGFSPTLLCSPSIRLGLRKFFSDTFSKLVVVAYNEISPSIELQPLASIGLPISPNISKAA
ncbi:MAG: flagellar biosynthesis protein FlhA [Verrucomicrobiota bacterium]